MWAQVVLWLLAIYGTVTMLWQSTVSFGFRRKTHEKRRSVCFIIIAENAERDIEAVLHNVYQRCLHMPYPTRVYVIDVLSTDLTHAIVERFSTQFMTVESRTVSTLDGAIELAQHLDTQRNSVRCIIQLRNGEAPNTVVR